MVPICRTDEKVNKHYMENFSKLSIKTKRFWLHSQLTRELPLTKTPHCPSWLQIEVLLPLSFLLAFFLLFWGSSFSSGLLSLQQHFLLLPLRPLSCQSLTQPELCGNGWGVNQWLGADSEGDSSSIFTSLDRVHLVPPQLTTLNKAIFVGEAIIPSSRQSIKSNAHGVDSQRDLCSWGRRLELWQDTAGWGSELEDSALGWGRRGGDFK